MSYEKMHEKFQRRLEESQPSVEKVVEWLKEIGYENCWANPITVAPTLEERRLHKDDGDITLMHPTMGKQIVEVHRLSRPFTKEHWFNPQFFIVDRKGAFDEKKEEPLAYVILNPSMTVGGIVNVPETRDHWWSKKLRNAGNSDPLGKDVFTDYWVCDPKLVHWRDMPC